MFLDYFALGVLVFVAVTLFYAIIAIDDVPYEIAKHRDHPHQDAIHVAGAKKPKLLQPVEKALMDLLLILTYTAICYAIFKIFKIPVNKWTVPTAALGA